MKYESKNHIETENMNIIPRLTHTERSTNIFIYINVYIPTLPVITLCMPYYNHTHKHTGRDKITPPTTHTHTFALASVLVGAIPTLDFLLYLCGINKYIRMV